MSDTRAATVVWTPGEELAAGATLTAFMRAAGIDDYEELLRRSAADPGWYWDAVIRFFDIRFQRPYERIMDQSRGRPWTRWCVGGTTNAVTNCLDRHLEGPVADTEAIVWESEQGEVRRWSYRELHSEVCRVAAGLRSLGLGRGDVVALFMPMLPETMAAFFAAARIGAIVQPLFSGFGKGALVARMNDAATAAVITADATPRRGRPVALKALLDEAAAEVRSLRHVVVVNHCGSDPAWNSGRDHWWHELDGEQRQAEEMDAEDPFMLLYTSGTTGRAKGTVHTHCGFPVKMASDWLLTLDLKRDDRWMWMTDMGWVVGPITAVAVTLAGATMVLGEGTPDWPDRGRMWRLAAYHRVSYLGVAPTIVRAMMRDGGEDEVQHHDLSSLRVTVSSGELWNPDSWLWFFDHVCRRRVPILNLSGGTEVGCGIVSSTVLQPAKPCSFSGSMPGMAADIVDRDGNSVAVGETGELVMREASIGLTRGLWNDPQRYLDTYWNRIPGMWVHGDWASRDADGMWYLHGRSDDTIMVAGKRCGPVEVESLVMATGKVSEAAASAVPDELKGEAVVCACVAAPGVAADDSLERELADAVVAGLGPAFRPRRVILVSELPKTRNMKVMRRVLRAAVAGKDPGDLASLVNPDSVRELQRKSAART